MYKQAGFTLVEISIVLVIIGLILGAVFVGGQTLIANTKTTGTITLIKDLSGAVADFKSRYHYLPGDLPKASDDISGACNIDTSTAKIGNGLIDTPQEINCVPSELILAGFVKGSPTATGFVSPLNNGSLPDVFVKVANMTAVTTFPNTVQNVIEIVGIPCETANGIDGKIDDGDTSKGNVMSNPPCVSGASGVPPTTVLDVGL
jgi:prepilin-type N-terminal cleavage/methylation domain-containing protein